MADRICTNCYHVGEPISQGLGSFAVDILMWLMFFSLSMFSSLFVLMLVPLAWTVFHIAVYNKTTCPQCGRLNMVALDSKKGRAALAGPSVVISYSAAADPERSDVAEDGTIVERRSRRSDDK